MPSATRLPSFIILLSLALSIFTGAAGLMHESIWQRHLSVLLGSSARASAVVLTTFLLGLGIGYQLFGGIASRRSVRSLLTLTAIVEVLIAVFGFVFPFVVFSTHSFLASTNDLIQDISTAAVGILPAAICMGATLPLLSGAFAKMGSHIARDHSLLYAANTFGACFGAVLTPSVLFIALGVDSSRALASGLNLGAGVLFFLLGRFASTEANEQAERAIPVASGSFPPSRFLVLAFLVGAVSLVVQSGMIRLSGLAIGSSHASFALIVGSHILCIAVGTLLYSSFSFRASLTLLLSFSCAGLILLYTLANDFQVYALWLRAQFPIAEESFFPFQLYVFLSSFVLLFPTLGSIGAIPPRIFSVLETDSDSASRSVGAIYAANTLGTTFGALLGGYLSLSLLDFNQLFSILLIVLGACFLCLDGTRLSKLLSVSSFSIGFVLLLIFPWDQKRLAIGLFRENPRTSEVLKDSEQFYDSFKDVDLLFYEDGRSASIAVLEFPADGDIPRSRSIMINGKPDGNTDGDKRTMRLASHLPLLLAPSDPTSALIIGFGTGMTLDAATKHERLKEIACVEISDTVMKAAPLFDEFTDQARLDPRVTIAVDDVYHWLSKRSAPVDVIISQPSNPWMAGIEKLFTRDFFLLAKERMSTDGLFLQWVAGYHLGEESFRNILSTFRSVFPHIRVFENNSDILLIGSQKQLELNTENLVARFENPEVRTALADLNIMAPEALLAMEAWVPKNALESKRAIHTLLNPKLAETVAVDFFMQREFSLRLLTKTAIDRTERLGAAHNSFLSQYAKVRPLDYKALVLSACGSMDVTLLKDSWRAERTPCRDALVTSYFLGHLSPPEWLAPEIGTMRKLFAINRPPDPETPRPTAMKLLQSFSEYQSPLLPLSPVRLRELLSPCFSEESTAALQCRSLLIQALVQSNHCEEASAELNGLSLALEGINGGAKAIEELKTYYAIICN